MALPTWMRHYKFLLYSHNWIKPNCMAMHMPRVILEAVVWWYKTTSASIFFFNLYIKCTKATVFYTVIWFIQYLSIVLLRLFFFFFPSGNIVWPTLYIYIYIYGAKKISKLNALGFNGLVIVWEAWKEKRHKIKGDWDESAKNLMMLKLVFSLEC